MKKLNFLILFLGCSFSCLAQLNNPSIRDILTKGNQLLSQGRPDLAVELYEKLLNQQLDEKNPDTAQLYDQLSIALWNLGRLENALAYQHEALQLRSAIFSENAEEIANSYNNLGLIYASEDIDKSLENYEKALAIYHHLYGENHPKIANTYNNIALLYMQKKDYGMANEYFADVLRIRKQYFGENHPSTAFVYQSIAQLYLAQEHLKEALSYLDNALSIYQKHYGNKHPEIANVYNLIGTIKIKQKKYDDALISFQKALIANSLSFDDTDLTKNPDGKEYLNGQLLLVSLMLKAQALETKHYHKSLLFKDLKLALQTLEVAISLSGKLRHQLSNNQDKIALSKISSEIYEDAVRIAYAMSIVSISPANYQKKAFEFSEKNKASILLEAMADANAKSFAGIPEEVLDKEKNLNATIAFLEQQLAEEVATTEKELRTKLLETKEQKERFIKDLEEKYPNYFELKFSNETARVEELQKMLREKQTLVSYFIPEKESRIYVFVLTTRSFKAYNLPQLENFQGLADGLRTSIRFQVSKPYTQFAYQLYRQLIHKVIPPHTEHLIIIPDGKLNSIPFEALLTKSIERDFERYEEMPFLVKKFAISYNFSATLYLQNKRKPRRSMQQGILLCAPIHFEGNHPHPIRSALSSLLATEREVKEIENIFTSKNLSVELLTQQAAQERHIKSEKIKYFQYIHFATHGLVDAHRPERSQVFLAHDDTYAEDGSLYTGEIYNLHLDADLVTLSACETGTGKFIKGEGVVGLSRALTYAGARNMIVSLWAVADDSTAELMIDFYQHLLNDGASTAYPQSLREAKKQMIDEKKFASPYYWSPFILIGE